MRNRIRLTRMDALKLLEAHGDDWPAKTLIYLDPPYYEKGRRLYYDFYEARDHVQIYRLLTKRFAKKRWVISYDDVPPIRDLYRERQQLAYGVGYSARDAREGAEIMFFSDVLRKSPILGPLRLTE